MTRRLIGASSGVFVARAANGHIEEAQAAPTGGETPLASSERRGRDKRLGASVGYKSRASGRRASARNKIMNLELDYSDVGCSAARRASAGSKS